MKAYVINLDKYPKRWERLEDRLPELGLEPVRIPGVVLKEKPPSFPTLGAAGCFQAQRNAWQRIAEAGEAGIVFEDDVKFWKELTQFPQDLFPDKNVVLFGASQTGWGNVKIVNGKDHYPANHRTFGAFAYRLSVIGAERLLKSTTETGTNPADNTLRDVFHIPGLRSGDYTPVCWPNLVIVQLEVSDIKGKRNRTKARALREAEKLRWELSHYD